MELVRTTSIREQARAADARVLTAALEDDTAKATSELAQVRAEMLAVRAALPDEDYIVCRHQLFDRIVPVDLLLAICARLDSPRDLGRLACTSTIFGRPVEWPSKDGNAPQRHVSVVEEPARRWVLRHSGAGMGSGKEQSWLQRMHEVQRPRFVVAHPSCTLMDDGAVLKQ